MKKLAVVITHPIQYNVPWLLRLREMHIQVKVFYTWEQAGTGKVYDRGFGKEIEWDIPLLEGYEYTFVKNTAYRPGVNHFWGIINPGLIGEIESWEPDSLLVFGWNFHSHLQCLRYFHNKIPVYFRGDSVLIHEKRGLRKIARRLFLTWVYRHVDYALYVGKHNQSYYLKHGLRPSQLVFSPQAIDIERFSSPDDQYKALAATWKKELGIPSSHLTILFAGKVTKVKNPGFVLQLAEKCKDLPISFIMVGNGKLKESMKRRSAGNERIIFLDFQNQKMMPVVYRLGDVFIMPSLSETWGMGINEAMACGMPVMASEKVGCAADLVLENKTGISFGFHEINKCKEFLKACCEDKSLIHEMGMNSKSMIQLFSFTYILKSISRLLNTTSGKKYKVVPRPQDELAGAVL